MRILVVNPNTTASMTEKIGAAARAVAAPGSEVVAVNPDKGPVSIEGFYDEAFSVPGLIEEIVKGEAAGTDGYVVACFDDPGLAAARTITERPVVGICEAAVHMATLVATRFSIVTTMQCSLASAEELVRRYGVAERCRVRWYEAAVLDFEEEGPEAAERLREEVRRAIEEDDAEAVLLGCAGMADLAERFTRDFGLPVIDGVAAAVKLVEALVGLGLKTSKVGGYAAPLPKAYSGDFAKYRPGGPGSAE
jgi:allantoin racemase